MNLFSMINIQLEMLRKKCNDADISIAEAATREEISNERNIRLITKLNDKIEKLQSQLDSTESGQMENKLRKTEERVRQLENLLGQHPLEEYKNAIRQNKEVIGQHESQIFSLETSYRSEAEKHLDDRVIALESNVSNLEAEKVEVNSKLIRIQDDTYCFNSISERVTTDFSKILAHQNTMQSELSAILSNTLPKHQAEINNLYADKLEKVEFHDTWTNHIVNMNNSNKHTRDHTTDIDEMERKLTLLSIDCKDQVEAIKGKLDKKIDFLHKWILKHLSNINQGGDTGNGDYTDIGKVRCLVCNHVTQRVDPDTPFTKPDFRNSLGVLHDRGKGVDGAMDDMGIPRTRFKVRVKESDNNPLYKLDHKLDPRDSPPGTQPNTRDSSPPRGSTANAMMSKTTNLTSLRPVAREPPSHTGADNLVISVDANGNTVITHESALQYRSQEEGTAYNDESKKADGAAAQSTSEFYHEMER